METDTQRTTIIKLTRNKKIIIGLALVILAAAGSWYYVRGWFIAATINGRSITRLEVVRLLEKRSGKQAIDSIITKILIQNEAMAKGITVGSDDIDQEIKKDEAGLAAQGNTLETALAQSGMTMADLRDQIETQKKLEKILGDKIQISDADIDQYIKDNKIALPKGSETESRNQIRSQLQQQKLSQEAPKLIADLKSKAKIQYYVNY